MTIMSPPAKKFVDRLYRELDNGPVNAPLLRELAAQAANELDHDELALLAMWFIEMAGRIARYRDDLWNIDFAQPDDETEEPQQCWQCYEPIPTGSLTFVPGNDFGALMCAACLPEAVLKKELERNRRISAAIANIKVPLRSKPILPQLQVLAELRAVVNLSTESED
jgi:hypothetical protein